VVLAEMLPIGLLYLFLTSNCRRLSVVQGGRYGLSISAIILPCLRQIR
jgi:hypothetical protein